MKALIKDGRLMSAAIYLIFIGIIGSSAEYIACSDCIIPFIADDLSSEISVYSPPGTVERGEDGQELIHYFGTDQLGRDVASRLIHGISIAFKVGIWSSFIALLIALVLGGLSGFLGNHGQRLNHIQMVGIIMGLFLIHFYAKEWAYTLNDRRDLVFGLGRYITITLISWFLLFWIIRLVGKVSFRDFWMPWDTIVVKGIEVFRSIPRLFFLLAIFAVITRPSLWAVIIIIGIIRWPALTRIIRAEIILLKQEDYIRNAQILGLPNWRILLFHVLPNIYKPIVVLTAFNMGSAILIEATLSFLQIGLPIDSVSWGSMLGDARRYIPAWWMAVGPGFLIFSLILAFNIIGRRLSFHFQAQN